MRSRLPLALHFALASGGAVALAPAQVRINEVAYADEGQEDREFVELYGAGSVAVSLANWTLRCIDATGLERVLATIPPGTALQPGGFYVIGSPGLAGVNLALTRFDALPNGTAALLLVDTASQRRDVLVWESYAGLSSQLASLAKGEGIWGRFLSTDAQPISWGRVRDGYDSQNERDYLLQPATPGSTNQMPALLPWQTTFDGATAGAVQNEFYGTRALVRAADPTVAAPWQLEPVPSSPQGGKIAVLGDTSTSGSAVALLADGVDDASFEAWVYLDARPLQTGERASWSIGLRGSTAPVWVPPAVAGLADLSNGNTGVSWTYLADASGAHLYLLDHNDGGYGAGAKSTPRIFADIPLAQGVNDGWQRLELAAFGPQIFAKIGGAVYGGTTTPALGGIYLAHVASVTNALRTRWLRFDEPQAKSFGDPIPFFVPNPAITQAGFPVQMQNLSAGAPDEWDWDFDNGSGQCCNFGNPSLPSAGNCNNSPNGATGAACSDPTTTYPPPVGPVPGLRLPTLKVGVTTGFWAPPCAISLVCVYPPAPNDTAPFLMYVPFNEVRGQQVCNAAASTAAPARMNVSAPNWQRDPQRAGFRGNEPGAGALGAGTSAFVDTGFPTELCGSVVIIWSTFMASTPAQEVAFCGAGPGGTLRITTGGSAGDRLVFAGTSIGRLVSAQNLQALNQWRDCALVIDNLAGTARFWIGGVPDGAVLFFTPGTFREKQGTSFRIGDHQGTPATAHFAIDAFGIEGHAASAQRIAELASGEVAHWCRFGAPCSTIGSTAPTAFATNSPSLGRQLGLGLQGGTTGSLAILVVGFGVRQIAGTPITLPLPLPAPFATGCELLVSLDVPLNAGVVQSSGVASVGFSIPMDPLLSGAHAYAQWLLLNPAGSTATDALDLALR